MSNALMTMGDSGPHIDRAYAASARFQWVRELIVNSAQANADFVKFGTEWEAVRELDVHRRIVMDNGVGIPRAQMLEFLNRFGGSGQTVGATEGNFGIGAKTSSLRWNRHGMVIISRHDGEESMLWLHYKPEDNSYGARELDIDNASGLPGLVVPLDEFEEFYVDDDIDWTKVFPKSTKDREGKTVSFDTGTAIVFLGDDGTQHTVLGDPNREEWVKYGIVKYCNEAFVEVPDNMAISVEQYEVQTAEPKDWPKDPKDTKQDRYVVGLKRAIKFHHTPSTAYPDVALQDRGVLTVPGRTPGEPGAQIEWWLLKDTARQKSQQHQSYLPTFPITSVAYSSHDDVTETFSRGTPQISPTKFVKPAAVNQRLSVLITPIQNGKPVFPDYTRQTLRYESATVGGADLPYEYWIDYWHENMPEPVRTALDAYYASGASGADPHVDDIARLGKRLLTYFQHSVFRLGPHVNGDSMYPGSGSRRSYKKTGRRTTRSGGDSGSPDITTSAEGAQEVPAKPRKQRIGMVAVNVRDDIPDSDHIIQYDRAEHIAEINRNSAVYKTTLMAILDEQVAKRGTLTEAEEAAVRRATERAMKAVACTAVTHSVGLSLEIPEIADDVLTDAALSTCLHGIQAVQSVASGYIGHELGEARKKKHLTSVSTA